MPVNPSEWELQELTRNHVCFRLRPLISSTIGLGFRWFDRFELTACNPQGEPIFMTAEDALRLISEQSYALVVALSVPTIALPPLTDYRPGTPCPSILLDGSQTKQ